MSRGLGKIGRVILAAITEADAADRSVVVLDDLYARAFPGTNRIEQRHRVSMLRAARAVAERSRHIPQYPGDGVQLSAHSWELDTTNRPARLHHSGHPQVVWATWQTDAGVVQWRKLRPDRCEYGQVVVTLYGRQHSLSGNLLRSCSPGSGSSHEGHGCQEGAEFGRGSGQWERVTVEHPLFTLSRDGFSGWERRYWTQVIGAQSAAFDARLRKARAKAR
jgi:hypothetical protein